MEDVKPDHGERHVDPKEFTEGMEVLLEDRMDAQSI